MFLHAALALNEFDGLGDFVCPGGASNCPIPDAKAAIDQLGLGRLTYWENIIVLLSMSAACRIIALLVLMRKYR